MFSVATHLKKTINWLRLITRILAEFKVNFRV